MTNIKTLEIFNLFTDYNGSLHISAGTPTEDFEIILCDIPVVIAWGVVVLEETLKVVREGDVTGVTFSALSSKDVLKNYRLSFYKAY